MNELDSHELVITIGNLVFSDVVTFLSDLLITITAIYFANRIKELPNLTKQIAFIGTFYRYLAVSAFIGGLGHLLSEMLPQVYFQVVSWLLLGVGVFYLQQYALYEIKHTQIARFLNKFVKVEFIVFFIFQLAIPVFHVAKWNSVVGVIGIFLPIQIYLYMQYRSVSERMIIVGVMLLIFSSIVHGFKYDLHPTYLDHKSLGHLFVVFFIIVNYLGISKKTAPVHATSPVSTR